jgi:glutathione synthase/RimK-type ligase-like ATP-grasp enzyme
MVIFTTTMMKILYYVFAFQLYSQEFYAKTKQNKTRQNKKKYTLLLELLQSGFEDYQQLQSTVVTICRGINGNNHEFICKVFDSFEVFDLNVMASPHRLWKLRNLMASTKMAAKKTAQPTSTPATVGRKLCLNPKLVWM